MQIGERFNLNDFNSFIKNQQRYLWQENLHHEHNCFEGKVKKKLIFFFWVFLYLLYFLGIYCYALIFFFLCFFSMQVWTATMRMEF